MRKRHAARKGAAAVLFALIWAAQVVCSLAAVPEGTAPEADSVREDQAAPPETETVLSGEEGTAENGAVCSVSSAPSESVAALPASSVSSESGTPRSDGDTEDDIFSPEAAAGETAERFGDGDAESAVKPAGTNGPASSAFPSVRPVEEAPASGDGTAGTSDSGMESAAEAAADDMDLLMNFRYEIDEKAGMLTLTRFVGSGTEVTVPAEYLHEGRLFRVRLSGNVFERCEPVTAIRIGSGVKAVGNCDRMFSVLPVCTELDVRGLDTSEATSMNQMFCYCPKLKHLDVSGFDTSGVTGMEGMFMSDRQVDRLDVSDFDTSGVTSFADMFNECTAVKELDVSRFDTSKGISFSGMFASCREITALDVSGFDTSAATDFSAMFTDLGKVKALDVSRFNTSRGTSFRLMFAYCEELESLDLSSFVTSGAKDMTYMFCDSGMKKLDLRNFDTSAVNDMSMMFSGSHVRELDLSSFDTGNVTLMKSMFAMCYSLRTLDLSSFSVEKVKAMDGIFDKCRFQKLVTPKDSVNNRMGILPVQMYDRTDQTTWTVLPDRQRTLYGTAEDNVAVSVTCSGGAVPEGVRLRVLDESGEVLIPEFRWEDGCSTFLGPGTYIVQMTGIPDGYQTKERERTITITEQKESDGEHFFEESFAKRIGGGKICLNRTGYGYGRTLPPGSVTTDFDELYIGESYAGTGAPLLEGKALEDKLRAMIWYMYYDDHSFALRDQLSAEGAAEILQTCVWYYTNPEPSVKLSGTAGELAAVTADEVPDSFQLTYQVSGGGQNLILLDGTFRRRLVGGHGSLGKADVSFQLIPDGPYLLTVRKTADGSCRLTDRFSFGLRLEGLAAGSSYPADDGTVVLRADGSGCAQSDFTLTAGGALTIRNLPSGCSYEVTEQTPEEYTASYAIRPEDPSYEMEGRQGTAGKGLPLSTGPKTLDERSGSTEVIFSNHLDLPPIRAAKTDPDGFGIAGAVLRVVGPDGETVDTWTTTTHAEYRNGSKTGRRLADLHRVYLPVPLREGTYRLTELSAPDGYSAAPDLVFEVSTRNGRLLVNGKDPESEEAVLTMVDRKDRPHSLTVRKEVRGNQASRNRYFSFSAVFEGLTAGSAVAVDLGNADEQLPLQEKRHNPLSVTADADGKAASVFFLQGGQSIRFDGLPEGCAYRITEEASGYQVTIEDSSGAETDEKERTDKGVLLQDTTVCYTNTREGIVPTGVKETCWPALLLLCFGAAVGAPICRRHGGYG